MVVDVSLDHGSFLVALASMEAVGMAATAAVAQMEVVGKVAVGVAATAAVALSLAHRARV